MTLLTADFELAPSGSTIPVTGGSAGFGQGFDDTGTSFTSDNTIPAAVASGSYCAKLTSTNTTRYTYRAWLWSGSVVHVRQYVYLTAYPTRSVPLWENYNGDTLVSRYRLNTDGTLGLAASSVTYTASPIPKNTLVRIEASFDHAAGTMSLDAYLAHSTTAISGVSLSLTGIAFPSTTLTDTDGVLANVTNFTYRTDAWAVSDTARVGPLAVSSSIAGATATVAAQADAGDMSSPTVGPSSLTGATAVVIVQGGNRPEPPAPVVAGSSWPPDPYRDAIRSGGTTIRYTVDAYLGGVPVAGATGLQPTGGNITDTTKPGVRRVLNLDLAPERGLFDLLAPLGTQLRVTCHVTYLNRSTLDIPMGVFDIDEEKITEGGGGGISLTAPDKWVRIQRARFVRPAASSPGLMVVDQIASLIRGVFGVTEAVAVSATSTAVVGLLTWEKDRDKAILEMAASIGAWVFFDRNGVATIADIPTIGTSADWLVDASASGVLTRLDRSRSRVGAANVVVVESSATTDADKFDTQVVWDNDPLSSTFAGPDPISSPELAGPFGVVVYYYDTPLGLGNDGAYRAGQTILARVSGLASQVSLGQVPNPALDAFAVLDVLPPKETYGVTPALERHVADTVTHPLTQPTGGSGGNEQHIEGRSTRADELSGGL